MPAGFPVRDTSGWGISVGNSRRAGRLARASEEVAHSDSTFSIEFGVRRQVHDRRDLEEEVERRVLEEVGDTERKTQTDLVGSPAITPRPKFPSACAS